MSSGVFPFLCEAAGLERPEPEHHFARPEREWRFDWAFVQAKVALEIEGGAWLFTKGKKSRHFHGKGIIKDMEKYNNAAIMGWRIIRVTPEQFERGDALALCERALAYVSGDRRVSPGNQK